MEYVVLGARCLIGLVFVTSAASKLRGRAQFDNFVASVQRFGLLPDGRARHAAFLVAAVEVAIPLLLAWQGGVVAGVVVALGLMTVLTGAIVSALRRGVPAPCACFGVSATPMGLRHLVRNGVLVAVALAGGVVVGFFSPGCSACKEQLPRFVEHANTLQRRQVLAVVTADGGEAGETIAALEPVARVVTEPLGGAVGSAFGGIQGFPAFCLVDTDRKVVASGYAVDAVKAPVTV